MDSFFDFIFGNLFFVVIIVAAIINFFSSAKKEEEKKRRQQQQRQRPTNRQKESRMEHEEREEKKRPSFRDLQEQLKEQFEQVFEPEVEKKQEDVSRKIPEQTIGVDKVEETFESIEEQRQKQYERLRKQYQTVSFDDEDDASTPKGLLQKRTSEEKVSIKVEKSFTRDGIIEGFIMSEVLGPPRALKPYENIAASRRKK